eukprot:4911457-Amphidinium_carterae.2
MACTDEASLDRLRLRAAAHDHSHEPGRILAPSALIPANIEGSAFTDVNPRPKFACRASTKTVSIMCNNFTFELREPGADFISYNCLFGIKSANALTIIQTS